MSFVDEATIEVVAGSGGKGGSHMKQIFGSKKRTPDGGNGGRGGNVFVVGSANVSDLSEFRFKKVIKAENGFDGTHKTLDGKKGRDVTFHVPLGTVLEDVLTGEVFEATDKSLLIARGGSGGIGNKDLKISFGNIKNSSGAIGERKIFKMQLLLNADVAIIGLPNAGKSSLLATLTHAKPKIADYPFTTVDPVLGNLDGIILADVPGLIKGSSLGKGLGIKFLKHIKKAKILLHLIDLQCDDIKVSYKEIRDELGNFDKSLLLKREIIVLTKADLIERKELLVKKKTAKKLCADVFSVSVNDKKSLLVLEKAVFQFFKK